MHCGRDLSLLRQKIAELQTAKEEIARLQSRIPVSDTSPVQVQPSAGELLKIVLLGLIGYGASYAIYYYFRAPTDWLYGILLAPLAAGVWARKKGIAGISKWSVGGAVCITMAAPLTILGIRGVPGLEWRNFALGAAAGMAFLISPLYPHRPPRTGAFDSKDLEAWTEVGKQILPIVPGLLAFVCTRLGIPLQK